MVVQLFGVWIVRIRRTLLELMRDGKKEERRTKLEFSRSIFSTVRSSNGTLGLYFT